MTGNFRDRFCSRFGVAPERFEKAVFRRTAYTLARCLRAIIPGTSPEFFAPDDDFIAGVARISRRSDFAEEAEEFAHHPANRGFLRRVLRIRVSIGRMQSLAGVVFEERDSVSHSHSPPPFARRGKT
jgi:hypothetical protein